MNMRVAIECSKDASNRLASRYSPPVHYMTPYNNKALRIATVNLRLFKLAHAGDVLTSFKQRHYLLDGSRSYSTMEGIVFGKTSPLA